MFSDLYIEQVLMGSIKSVGGLTRGRGFEESTRLTWLLSMPACGEVHKAMQDVTGVGSNTANATHKNLTPANLKRNAKDLQTTLEYIEERKPFSKTTMELRSISSGIIAEGSVNVDYAESVGSGKVASMVGQSVANTHL